MDVYIFKGLKVYLVFREDVVFFFWFGGGIFVYLCGLFEIVLFKSLGWCWICYFFVLGWVLSVVIIDMCYYNVG